MKDILIENCDGNKYSLEQLIEIVEGLDESYDFIGATYKETVYVPHEEVISYAVRRIDNNFGYKLIINPAMTESDKTIEFKFKSYHDMDISSNTLADMLMFLQDEIGVMPDYSNYFIKQKLVDGFWIDVD